MQILLYITTALLAAGLIALAYAQRISRGQIALYSLLIAMMLGMGSCAISFNEAANSF